MTRVGASNAYSRSSVALCTAARARMSPRTVVPVGSRSEGTPSSDRLVRVANVGAAPPTWSTHARTPGTTSRFDVDRPQRRRRWWIAGGYLVVDVPRLAVQDP